MNRIPPFSDMLDIKELLMKFHGMPPPKNIQNDYEYVDYGLTVLRQTQIAGRRFPNLLEKSPNALVKSNEISENMRRQGNELFIAGATPDVWHFYSRSILYAEPGSIQLGLAYANRSVFLFHHNLFKECLEDIERALENNYPKEKMHKLTKRRSTATELLNTQKPIPFYGEIPKIKNKNAQVPGASNNIKIENNKEFGRHIVASKEVNPGDVILVEKPYVSCLPSDSYEYLMHCSECQELCYNMIPCGKCIDAFYCTTACKRKAFVDYHRYECAILRYFGNTNRISLRLTLKGAKEHGMVNSNGGYKKCSKLFSGKDSDDTNSLKFIIHITAAAKIFYVLKNNTDFFSEFDIKDKENVLKGMLLRDLNICRFNSVLIRKWNSDNNITSTIGKGLYATLSLFNHACYENVMIFYYGNTVVLKAKRKIKQGEQCFINYGVNPGEERRAERQQQLSGRYKFICNCQACVQDWPIIETMTNRVKVLFTQLVRIYHQCMEVEIDRQKKDNLLQKTFNIAVKLENEVPCCTNELTTCIFHRLLFDGNSMANFRELDPEAFTVEKIVALASLHALHTFLHFSE